MIDATDYELLLQSKGFHRQSDGSWSKPAKADRVASDEKLEPNPIHEPVAEDTGARAHPGKRLVRLTSYRVRLLDERNLYDKYFVDALRYASVLFDDSPAWCKVEVAQKQVHFSTEERTEIEVFEL